METAELPYRPAVGEYGFSPKHIPPKAPRPSEDRGMTQSLRAPSDDPGSIPSDSEPIDLFALTPLAALKILTAFVETLVRSDGLTPPTPPASSPPTPRQVAKTQPSTEEEASVHGKDASSHNVTEDDGYETPPGANGQGHHHHQDVPRSHKTPIGSPETHTTEPVSVSAANVEQLSVDFESEKNREAREADDIERAQSAALARKFYSKAVPPIPLRAYLERLHTYCPMSTAVYLAAGAYVQRLAFGEPASLAALYHHPRTGGSKENDTRNETALPVTSRTAHRLLLAALRVATKALEDLTHSHARVAKVGGVSNKELSRLEVSLCFLMDFELALDEEVLRQSAGWMRAKAAALLGGDSEENVSS